ncbi:MAG: hypothetical protein SFY66_26655 [Oculatellaceae cyanobacterium bins.114]|nr:hypothetical protein [Oculatellaceae cyanobacterium bins.114]
MDKRADRKHQDLVVATASSTPEHDFNFDLWASAVKRQMIASLRKRGDQ